MNKVNETKQYLHSYFSDDEEEIPTNFASKSSVNSNMF